MADPIPNKPKAPSPAPADAPPATNATATSAPNNAAEVEQLRAENAGYKAAEQKRAVAIRRLAAAVLTPPDEADKGQGRRDSIQKHLAALISQIGMEEPK